MSVNAPVTGLRGETAALVKRAVRVLLMSGLEDRLLHAEMVAAGRTRFREAFVKDMGGFFGNKKGPCDDLADSVYGFFARAWRKKYPDTSPEFFLDKVEIVKPPSAEEIEDAWEVEIGSSDSAMRQMYEGSARHRKGKDLGAKQTKPEKVH